MKLIAALAFVALLAPVLAPYDAGRQFPGYAFAPPMRPHVLSEGWRPRLPFAYPLRPVDPIERRYEEDRSRRLSYGRDDAPWFLLGSDALGRDVLSRALIGARLSLGIALLATLLTLLLGAAAGAIAASAGGWVETLLMRLADLVMVLPGIYVVLALRGTLPLVLTTGEVFGALTLLLALVGWPTVARGVRGILAVERTAEYAEAARASGAGPWRLMVRHLLPAARGFLGAQATILVPAFVMAEATLSFVGLGFAPPTPSWGAMLYEAGAVRVAADAPWLLAPAGMVFLTVLAVHTAAHTEDPLRTADFTSKSF